MKSTKESNITILKAKLHRPRVTRELIVRPRLLALLDAGLARPLTAVVAPAGFGKSTLVSSWIGELVGGKRPGFGLVPAVWLMLDESDSDPNIFLHYFISGLRTVFPGAAPKTMALLTARQPPPMSLLADTLSNEIEGLPSRFVVVLDDVQTLHGQGVFDCLSFWARHWPWPMHLVLLSRLDPPLPLSNLRARGQLMEIRSRDLRFTYGETAEYLNRALGSAAEEPVLTALHQQMEGWITGLKLATLSPEARANFARLPEDGINGDVYVADFLIEEVLLRQPAGIQQFLLAVSIDNQFCKSLCNALLGDQDPNLDIRQCIDYLEANELFVASMDNQRKWYRLHQVFRDLLHRKLLSEMGEEAVDLLHVRAARWYAEHGLLDQALHHALEGKNLALAAQFMQQGFCDVLNRTDRPMLERWLQMLPGEVILQKPELLIMKAWGHALRWELEQALHVALQAEALLHKPEITAESDMKAVLQSHIAVLKSQAAYFNNQPDRAAVLCREVLALLPDEWRYVRGVAAIFLGMSLHSGGHITDAEQFLTAEYAAAANKAGSYPQQQLQTLVLNALQSGLFETAQRTAQVMLRHSNQSGLNLYQGWSHYLLGYIHYHWNDLEVAERHFAATVELRYTTQLLVARNGFIGLAAVYQAQGKHAAALATIGDLGRLDVELYGREEISTAAARARLLFLQGDLEGAYFWLEQVILPPGDRALLTWMDWPLLTKTAVLIARNTPADIAAAHDALDALDEIAVRTHSTRSRVEILALRALAQMAQGDVVAARRSLLQSITLSWRTGHIRVYVDLGPPMQNLLGQITGQGMVSEHISTILAAFEAAWGNGTRGVAASSSINHNGSGSTAVHRVLSENLTARELEVLTLMAEPISLAEISRQLHIAHSTTKRHTINLYEKLDVHSRWEAVAAAVELGILPPR